MDPCRGTNMTNRTTTGLALEGWRATVQRLPGASLGALWLLALLSLAPGFASAEPYLAVRSGSKCIACHVNPAGGGKRNEFGAAFGQTALVRERLDLKTGVAISSAGAAAESALWTGKLNDHVAIGGDLRANAQSVKESGRDASFAFNQTRAQLYLELKAIGDRLTFYLDERVAPGAATNRETFAMLWFADRTAYFKAGKMFVPFGLRIEDDTAFIRQVTGMTFNSSDDGVEGGLEVGPWSAQVSMTNGQGGAAEISRGKLVGGSASFVQRAWRMGLSVSSNFNGAADRRMQSVFGGMQVGSVSALASAVFVTDEATPIGRLRQRAGLVEANVEVARGQNLKFTYEHHDPNLDVREDQRARYSAVWEFAPFQFTQFRLGARKGDGIPQNKALNASELFAQWHAFF
jgi:hypothetical protein